MSLFAIVALSAVCLLIAYFTYGPLLVKLFDLRADRPTPAVQMRDDVDYAPIESKFLLSQHFSAIAAAGPIVGPILAGVLFGWLPALLWILIGSIFIGGIHDMSALVASIRHKARSIAEVVREHMNGRSYVLFLAFVWLALVYIIVAFTDVTASSFLGVVELENGDQVSGGGIASSSLLYLALPIIMGLLLKFTRLTLNQATIIFLPLVLLSIWAGQFIPFDLAEVFGLTNDQAHLTWNVALLLYCIVASLVPMWLLLQPRGHLGGYFLYVVLAAGAIGVMFGGNAIEYPAFIGWDIPSANGATRSLFPLLFITIACGACSGFHSVIASGTTSKQLQHETDARPIGYGAMLLEAMVAIVSLSCVMILKPDSPLLADGTPKPNFLYARGIGGFMSILGIPPAFAVSFGLMAFTTFVYDTLDVCTRLGRYILQELTGMQGRAGRWLATGVTAGAPLLFLIWKPTDGSGKPAWRIFWDLFGASNQLLAALTLLGVTVWLWRTQRKRWVLFLIGLPCVFMYVMSMWALSITLWPLAQAFGSGNFADGSPVWNPVPWVALVLTGLGVLLAIEAIIVLTQGAAPPALGEEPVPAAAS